MASEAIGVCGTDCTAGSGREAVREGERSKLRIELNGTGDELASTSRAVWEMHFGCQPGAFVLLAQPQKIRNNVARRWHANYFLGHLSRSTPK